jgi:hypothetical protein
LLYPFLRPPGNVQVEPAVRLVVVLHARRQVVRVSSSQAVAAARARPREVGGEHGN